MSEVRILHFSKGWLKFIQIHQYYTMAFILFFISMEFYFIFPLINLLYIHCTRPVNQYCYTPDGGLYYNRKKKEEEPKYHFGDLHSFTFFFLNERYIFNACQNERSLLLNFKMFENLLHSCMKCDRFNNYPNFFMFYLFIEWMYLILKI